MSIEIREHTPGRDINDFVRAGYEVFKFDPTWVPPLEFEFKERLSPKHNPFFNRADVTLFTAWKDGRLVGRCSASIDREYLRVQKDETGFFGFLVSRLPRFFSVATVSLLGGFCGRKAAVTDQSSVDPQAI